MLSLKKPRPFFLFLEMSLFQSICVSLPFSLCMESTSYVFPFRVVFFYLVTTGWIFFINSSENSIDQSLENQGWTTCGIQWYART